jgi:DNA primase
VRISESYKDKVLAATDIVGVIGKYVELRKAGKEWIGRCPFHDEKSPSFYVNAVKGVYICRGCRATGSVIRFLMEYEHISFHDALEVLAKDASMLPLQYEGETTKPSASQTAVYAALEHAASFFQSQLSASPDAMAYCQARGLSDESIARFRIGFAPASWDSLSKSLQRYDRTILAEAGLITVREDKRHFDRFRNRLMFPILDRRGRVIAFGGRVMSENAGPKYLNSADSELFHKGEELFGLWHALHPAAARQPGPGSRPDRLIVVEGFVDVISLHQHGVTQAVATLGTALTAAHAAMLFPLAPNLVFCFDGDRAGYEAAWRAMEAVLPHLIEGRRASFIFLPQGSDPDSLIRAEGGEVFAQRIDAAQPLSAYLFGTLSRYMPTNTAEGRASYADRAVALIRQVPAGSYQNALLSELATRTGIRINLGGAAVAATAARPSAATPPPDDMAIFALCGILLAHPSFARDLPARDALADVAVPETATAGRELLLALRDFLIEKPNASSADTLRHVLASALRPSVDAAGNAMHADGTEHMLYERFTALVDRIWKPDDKAVSDPKQVARPKLTVVASNAKPGKKEAGGDDALRSFLGDNDD